MGRQDFDGHVAIHRGLVRLEDSGHPALADLLQQSVGAQRLADVLIHHFLLSGTNAA
jgi:hypothetical protein